MYINSNIHNNIRYYLIYYNYYRYTIFIFINSNISILFLCFCLKLFVCVGVYSYYYLCVCEKSNISKGAFTPGPCFGSWHVSPLAWFCLRHMGTRQSRSHPAKTIGPRTPERGGLPLFPINCLLLFQLRGSLTNQRTVYSHVTCINNFGPLEMLPCESEPHQE